MAIPSTPAESGSPELSHTPFHRVRSAIFDGTLKPGEAIDYWELQRWLGLSDSAARDVMRELAKVGLIEAVDIERPRVVLPALEERDQIIQCLGALLGGVARVTIPALPTCERESLSLQLGQLLEAVGEQEPYEYAAHTWQFIEFLVHACPNPELARATQGRIEALSYLISLTQAEEAPQWDRLHGSYSALRSAIDSGDAVAAELALEHAFRITGDSVAQLSDGIAEPAPSVLAGDDVAVTQMVGALLGATVRLTAAELRGAELSRVLHAVERAQGAAHAGDIARHREHGSALVRLLLEACPNRHLVNTVKNTIESLGDQLDGIWTQQANNWHRVISGYEDLAAAIWARDAIGAELAFEKACLL
ncbi:FCD domain-containing protein [Leucobacter japonicus]|uniref:FCD domain-containing protein n=1 Tax=Leucobacter japonicus TaxID=1461259 RepID=UPI0006A7B56C|nr:FCD domain-containing protein [Leucobacter japonicus]